ncbi:TRIC cation channel family protein [Actinospica durhamensis]|uniref:TRIC cation channel family protein n=1 Tax=Actinospica durhamensis TaxID=1508375 RepID=A0A941IMT0_9ACTN|nr:TRIC cation channel family protein [Actinospica durhamensis]MBR7833204.1 TRIC cation channel family protein [Actinospica durhamensis]
MRPALAPHLPIVFDLLGVLTASSAGALTGVRKNLDLVGVVVLAAVTGLGGGVIRDLMIGAVPVAMLTDWRYLTAAALAAGLVLLGQHPRVLGRDLRVFESLRGRVPLGTAYLVADSATLGCFAVSGTAKALDYGLALVPAALMGVVTAVGGGVVRDVLVNEVPTVLRRELYAVPALVGSLVVAATDRYDPAATPIAFLAAALTMGLRMVSVRRDWHARLPQA